ncbi:MAG: M3 family oligoendopeptidase [Fusicatenibacter sp.]|nr:M3 family oligoendopeptidase [Fusicatenibacter sp.]
MEKFSKMQYLRPDMEAVQSGKKEYIEELKKASSYQRMRELFLDQKKKEEDWYTMAEIANIRYTADTRDPFYEQEIQYLNQEIPQITILDQQAEKVILNSPYRIDFEEEFGSFFIRNMEMRQKLADECIVEDMVREADLTQQYSKVSATASTMFRGEECNFYGLLKHMQSTDRRERKEAMMAWGDLYEKISGELDELYDKLVALRVEMAKKLGFESYIDFIYLSYGRYDYNAADVAKFRSKVKEVIVPVCEKLRKEQEKRLGVDQLHYYDEELIFPDGNAVPNGDKETLVALAQKMYHEISPETGEFFDFMAEHELFDLETRPGKRPGGYCTFLPLHKAPFIFSNFNGTSADVDVLTHEAGHAFEAYTAAKKVPLMEMIFPTSEVAEIHSMSMEHFAYPWMEWFFGEKADDYRYAHLMNGLEVIPYMVCVDEFQHRVFENPEMTAKERRQVWHELEVNYMPWRNYDGHPFLEEGGFWMQKQHIFLFPFYYIDYALAQICAFQFYGRAKEDFAKAWKDYYRLCQAGGSRGYFELLETAGLDNPFHEGTIKAVIDGLMEDLR